jgi:hypothetical protein
MFSCIFYFPLSSILLSVLGLACLKDTLQLMRNKAKPLMGASPFSYVASFLRYYTLQSIMRMFALTCGDTELNNNSNQSGPV